jgi:hypothetical protein
MPSTHGTQEINPHREGAAALLEASPVMRIEHREDLLTRMLEQQAAKVPSGLTMGCTTSS